MKKTILGICISMAFISCSKDEAQPVVITDPYLTLTANSTWNYELVDSVALTTTPYVLKATNVDSIAGTRSYRIFTNSIGPNEYYNITNKQYRAFEKVPPPFNAGNKFEHLYLLEDPEGTTWTQTHNASATPPAVNNATFNNKIEKKGISKTVKNIVYNNVIHVKTTITMSGVTPGSYTGEIDAYFAPKVGMIQRDTRITWVSTVIGTFQLKSHIKLVSSTIL